MLIIHSSINLMSAMCTNTSMRNIMKNIMQTLIYSLSLSMIGLRRHVGYKGPDNGDVCWSIMRIFTYYYYVNLLVSELASWVQRHRLQ